MLMVSNLLSPSCLQVISEQELEPEGEYFVGRIHSKPMYSIWSLGWMMLLRSRPAICSPFSRTIQISNRADQTNAAAKARASLAVTDSDWLTD